MTLRMCGVIAGLTGILCLAASSASANATHIIFCKQAQLTCESTLPLTYTAVAHAVNPRILSSLGTVECEKSLTEVTVLNELSELILAHLLALSFEGNCHLGGTACTVTTETLGLHSFTKTGSLTASVRSTGGTKVKAKCGSFINCTFGGEPVLVASSSAGGEITLTANKAVLKGEGFLCPLTSEFDATYGWLGQGWIES